MNATIKKYTIKEIMQEKRVHAVLETEKLAVPDAVPLPDAVPDAVADTVADAVADALAVGVAHSMLLPLLQKYIVTAPASEFWSGAPTTRLIPVFS